jgi:2-iminoacetate synthase ThiH
MQKITCGDGTSSKSFMYTPVPYNIEIALYIITKTQEDGLQILEQILPTFTPEYNLAVKVVPEMNVIQDVPVILNSVSVTDEYDGDFQTRRFVTHTLSFTLKTNMFGAVSSQGVINEVNANIGFDEDTTPSRIYVAQGDTSTGNLTSEDWIDTF